MNPYLQDADLTLYQGDALEVLRGLPDKSVHMCVTSPPFYGLRDYGTGRWEAPTLPERGSSAEWLMAPRSGSDWATCDHLMPPGGGTDATGLQQDGRSEEARQGNAERIVADRRKQYRDVCGKCGASRVDQQIGLEETPEQWVAALVAVFREVRRVLRGDGTCWVEVGDSYNGAGSNSRTAEEWQAYKEGYDSKGHVIPDTWGQRGVKAATKVAGFKPKDLIGAPWLLAFALRADGWYLRSDIVWSRPNPMPESVTDRPTKSHSYVFLLSKSARYFFDQEAVREKSEDAAGRLIPDGYKATWQNGNIVEGKQAALRDPVHFEGCHPAGRNVRSVWSIATEAYPDAHFATYPQDLVRRCILAGSSERGCCPECGAPWERQTELSAEYRARLVQRERPDPFGDWLRGKRLEAGLSTKQLCSVIGAHGAVNHGGAVSNWENDKNIPTPAQWSMLKEALSLGDEKDSLIAAWHEYERGIWGTTPDALTHGAPSAAPALSKNPRTLGWVPSCAHGLTVAPADGETPVAPAPVPCTVLDPFAGSGTTGLVARKHGRRSILIELSAEYCGLVAGRTQQLSLEAKPA